MGESDKINPFLWKYSRMAKIISSRTRKIAICRAERNHKWRLCIKNSGPCSLGVMG